MEAEVLKLASEVGQNFLLSAGEARYVLKIFNSDEDPDFLTGQFEALEHVRVTPSDPAEYRLASPRVIPRSDGGWLAPIRRERTDVVHQVGMVAYIPGRPLADVAPVPETVLTALGRGLGDLDRRLASFEHPSMRREYLWDLADGARALRWADHIQPAVRREVVESHLRRFEDEVRPALAALPHQVIHNDANDHNVLLRTGETGLEVTGLLDFGDMLWAARACEPAIAMAYAMMHAADPVVAGSALLSGYHETCPLAEAEILLLRDLIMTRLCVSVTVSAARRRSVPDNAYLLVSEAPAWRLVDRLGSVPPARVADAFLHACGSGGASRS